MPAVIMSLPDGARLRMFYTHGKKSNVNGPAVEVVNHDGTRRSAEWWVDGMMVGPTLRDAILAKVARLGRTSGIFCPRTGMPQVNANATTATAYDANDKVLIGMKIHDRRLHCTDGPAVVYGCDVEFVPEWWKDGEEEIPTHTMVTAYADRCIAKCIESSTAEKAAAIAEEATAAASSGKDEEDDDGRAVTPHMGGNGTLIWRDTDGQLHRPSLDGCRRPAVIRPDGVQKFYTHGSLDFMTKP
jgi:hypothetical protein